MIIKHEIKTSMDVDTSTMRLVATGGQNLRSAEWSIRESGTMMLRVYECRWPRQHSIPRHLVEDAHNAEQMGYTVIFIYNGASVAPCMWRTHIDHSGGISLIGSWTGAYLVIGQHTEDCD